MIRSKPADSPFPARDELHRFLTGKSLGSAGMASVTFCIAAVDVVKHFRDYGRVTYGDRWFHQSDPEYGAAFGLKKFAERLYDIVVTKRLRKPPSDKLLSDAMDAAVFALFLVALIQSGRAESLCGQE